MTKTNHSQCDWGEGHSEGFQAGVELERESTIDYLRDLQCDVLAYKKGYDVGTLQAVINWIEGRDNV